MIHIELAPNKMQNLLEKSNEYTFDAACDPKFIYEYPNFWIRRKMERAFQLSKIPYGKSEFVHMANIMKYVYDLLNAGERDGVTVPETINSFEVYKVIKNTKTYANCWMHSVMLTEIYLTLGYKARMVRCMTRKGTSITECHCVTLVYSNQYNKWIIMDAANRAYYLNEDMVPMDIIELKQHFVENKNIIVPGMPKERVVKLLEYFRDHVYYFQTYLDSRYNIEGSKKYRIRYTLHSKNEYHNTFTMKYAMGGTIEERYTTDVEFFMKKPEEEGVVNESH